MSGLIMVVGHCCIQVDQQGDQAALRIVISEDLIKLVFAEKPHVKKSYDKQVPTHMSAKEFWTKYVKYELHKEVRFLPPPLHSTYGLHRFMHLQQFEVQRCLSTLWN
jgi:hypothetical protein